MRQRDQDIDFGCVGEQDEELQPLQVRYGVTAEKSTHREPLDSAVSQEEGELDVGGEGTWDNVEPEHPGVV